jgi:predicted nucleic acid-binding protein
MAEYVIDTTAVMNYLIADSYTLNAEALFDRVTDADRLITQEFCLLEYTNVLWKQVRFHGMTYAQAQGLLRDLWAPPLHRAPMKRLLKASLDVALAHGLAVYDSAYLALSSRFGYPLITLDRQQQRAAVAEGISLKPLTDFQP